MQVVVERRHILVRQLEGAQHPAIVGAVVAVVEQADVPAAAEGLEKAHQGARLLRKLETVETFTEGPGRAAANHVTHVVLGQLALGHVDHRITVAAELIDDLAELLVTATEAHRDEQRGLLGIGVAVVELGHHARPQIAAEVEEGPLALGDGHRQHALALLANLAALGDVAQAMEVDVGAGQNGRHPATLHLLPLAVGLEAGQGQGSRRLGDGAAVVEDVFQRGADLVVGDGHHLIQILVAEAKGLLTDALDRHPVGKQRDSLQIDRLAGRQRGLEAGGALRLHPDHLHIRQQLLDVDRHPRGQAAAAHRHEDVGKMGILLQQLLADGALPGDHLDVVKRRDQGVALQLGETAALAVSLVEAVAEQQHVAALAAHRIDLDVRRGLGHHDDRLDTEPGGRQGDPLGVVAGRGGDDAALLLLLGQGGDLVVGAAQLEGVDRLQILPLEGHMVAEPLGEFFQGLQRCHPRRLIDGGEQHLA